MSADSSSNAAESSLHVLSLESISWSGPQLYIDVTFDGVKFPSVLWYDFNLNELHAYYGDEVMERVYFHIAAFTLLKLTSLKPSIIRISDKLTKHYTVHFQELWKTSFKHILGQWHYENSMANWKGPEFYCSPQTVAPVPAKMKAPQVFNKDGAPVENIQYCGGGKDGLLAMKLLEGANTPFSTFSYSISRYGSARAQFERAQSVLQGCKAVKSHFVMITDTFLDIPVDHANDQWMKKLGIKNRSDAALTELFSILPVMLHYGYWYAVIGNEHSANIGNLEWADEEGRQVNHQWEKSFEAEQVFSRYISQFIVAEGYYYSILQPIHDVMIFTLLRQYSDAVPFCHSCNLIPPWCKRCPKCCYVWLSFQAYLPKSIINPMFDNENLLDAEENQLFFTQMLGLGDQKPFECIGEIREVQLAFELCRRKGIHGRAMEVFEREFGTNFDVTLIVKCYTTVHKEKHSIPEKIAEWVIPEMERAATCIKAELQ